MAVNHSSLFTFSPIFIFEGAEADTIPIDHNLPHAKVVVPLYIYPLDDSTWQPLYKAIAQNPSLDFVVIVNPDSGPGGLPLPEDDYVHQVPKLNAYPNVQTVGYVKVDWCRRPLSETFRDIEIYARWSEAGIENFYLEGIFLDETPNHFSKDRAEYLHVVRKYIKALPGLKKEQLILENPGTPPDKRLSTWANCSPDVIFTCEVPYEQYSGRNVQQRLNEYHYDREMSGYMISGVPAQMVYDFTRKLRHRGAYIFVTDVVKLFYESFGKSWLDFLAAMK